VFVLDQTLKNNSYVSFINTNVWRFGDFRKANTSALVWLLKDNKNKYAFGGRMITSNQFGNNFSNLNNGVQYVLNFSKISGNLNYTLGGSGTSPTYNNNDFGYSAEFNTMYANFNISYSIYKPFWGIFRRFSTSIRNVYQGRFKPYGEYVNFSINPGFDFAFNNNLSLWCYSYIQPAKSRDYYEPRTRDNRYYLFPSGFSNETGISSDYTKRFAIDASINTEVLAEDSRYSIGHFVNFRFMPSHHLLFTFSTNIYDSHNNVGYSYSYSSGNRIVLGRRDVYTVTCLFNTQYFFNPNLSVSLRIRDYWSKARYNRYYNLNDDGTLGAADDINSVASNLTADNNSFTAFTIDAGLRWIFTPGSELTLVWKNAIFNGSDNVADNYYSNLRTTLKEPQTNNISIKIF
jgi:hypothetical protein